MDFDYPSASQAFRAEVRAWLGAKLPSELCGWTQRDPLTPELFASLRVWTATVADAGFGAIAWPREHGGRDAGAVEQLVMAEELARADAPAALNPIGLSNVAPSIMAFGTDTQRDRHLQAILRADEIWCQGFSEPDAGSDLASLRTTATADGDGFVVTGTKVWNTLGRFADRCELLVRTDPTAPRHAGLSVLLVDMRSPGITVRPLRTMTGGIEFSELHFDGVRVPEDDLLGPLHQGWRVAMTTLSHERAGVANLHLRVRAKVDRLLAAASASGATADAAVRQVLASRVVDAEVLRLLALRAISSAAVGREPGPAASLAKLVWTRSERALADAAAQLLGPSALILDERWSLEICGSPAAAIVGGTTEIQKNILAERILGLPR